MKTEIITLTASTVSALFTPDYIGDDLKPYCKREVCESFHTIRKIHTKLDVISRKSGKMLKILTVNTKHTLQFPCGKKRKFGFESV